MERETKEYIQGYDDGWNKIKPVMPDDEDYMAGWEDGYNERLGE